MENKRISMLEAGNIAKALIRGLLASKTLRPDQLRASDVRVEHLHELEKLYGIQTYADNAELVAWANVIVLAVKPQVIDRVLDQLSGSFTSDTLLISVAAGVPIRALEARLPTGARV